MFVGSPKRHTLLQVEKTLERREVPLGQAMRGCEVGIEFFEAYPIIEVGTGVCCASCTQ